MRGILFKAKRKNWSEFPKNDWWVEGYPVKYQPCASKNEYVYGIVPTYASALYIIEIVPDTLCQYTGLTNMEGEMIWENDIVKYTDEITNKICLDLIKYDKKQASFVRVHTSAMGEQYLSMHKISSGKQEVIGNIFDNPELLGQDGEKNA